MASDTRTDNLASKQIESYQNILLRYASKSNYLSLCLRTLYMKVGGNFGAVDLAWLSTGKNFRVLSKIGERVRSDKE